MEITTGPLGQGLASSVGMAMAARYERGLFDPDAAPGTSPFDHFIYVIAVRRLAELATALAAIETARDQQSALAAARDKRGHPHRRATDRRSASHRPNPARNPRHRQQGHQKQPGQVLAPFSRARYFRPNRTAGVGRGTLYFSADR